MRPPAGRSSVISETWLTPAHPKARSASLNILTSPPPRNSAAPTDRPYRNRFELRHTLVDESFPAKPFCLPCAFLPLAALAPPGETHTRITIVTGIRNERHLSLCDSHQRSTRAVASWSPFPRRSRGSIAAAAHQHARWRLGAKMVTGRRRVCGARAAAAGHQEPALARTSRFGAYRTAAGRTGSVPSEPWAERSRRVNQSVRLAIPRTMRMTARSKRPWED
jgi:hypothetical protein